MLACLRGWSSPTAPWLHSSRIIEFDLGDALLVQAMRQEAGPDADRRYLAVLPAEHAPLPEHVPHVVVTGDLPVRHNNAQVLVLSGRARWHALRWTHLRHASWVVLRWEWGVSSLVALLALLLHAARGKLRYTGCKALGEGPRRRWCIAFAVQKPAPRRSARRYVPHALGMPGFLRQLAELQVRHAVLRWFDALPALPAGEDLDLLVADEDLPKVETLLELGPGVQPCDLYTVSGLPGTDLEGLPYFPPFLAQEIIDHARPHPSGAYVPDPRRHFLSLAYHVVFHKGPKSGLPLDDGPEGTAQRPSHLRSATGRWWAAARRIGGSRSYRQQEPAGGCEHDYAAVLKQLAKQLGWSIQPTLRSLDALLAEQAWRPPRDMLARLSRRRPLLRALLDEDRQQRCQAAPPGLAVFILRQAAVTEGG